MKLTLFKGSFIFFIMIGSMNYSKWTILRKEFVPAYLKLYKEDKSIFESKVETALKAPTDCTVCPRNSRVNRLNDKYGVCRIGRHAAVSSAFSHFGEEDCLKGWKGSGTIFFSYCNLKCVFCQNFDISWKGDGFSVTPNELARMMIHLQGKGCHNINFVTPEHVVPQIMEAIPITKELGLRLPIVYNTGSYDSTHSLKLMEGIVDIYLPDFKFRDPGASKFYLTAKDYP